MIRKKKICYVVLTYNNYLDTIETVEGILKQTEIQWIDIYLIDNNSNETYANKVLKYAEKNGVKYIYRNINDGYTGGNNYAWELLKNRYNYIVIVNNDILFNSSTLTRSIVEIFEQIKNIGIIGPVVYYGNDVIVKPSKVLKIIFRKRINYHKFVKSEKYIECDSVIGCYLAINTNVIKYKKLFNESFFMYGEELELCLRAWRDGYRVVHLTDARESIYHKGGNNPFSESDEGLWKYYLSERNIILCAKNLQPLSRIQYLFVMWLSVIYRLGFKRLSGEQRKAIKQGFKNGLRFLSKKYDENAILNDALSFIDSV